MLELKQESIVEIGTAQIDNYQIECVEVESDSVYAQEKICA